MTADMSWFGMSTSVDVMGLINGFVVILGGVLALGALAGAARAGVFNGLHADKGATEAGTHSFNNVSGELLKANRAQDQFMSGRSLNEELQLLGYYKQISSQARIGFWFSLFFASIGFTIVASAVFVYSSGDLHVALLQYFIGVAVEAVAALIFIKSKNAEKLLSEFFEKTRRDKQHLESRKICDLIENPSAKDALRIHLSLHFAEVEQASEISKVISDACLSGPDYKSQNKEFGF